MPAAADVIRHISPQDAMFEGDESAYFASGDSALEAITVAMRAAGTKAPARILDLPCGHGRVLRTLKAAFPEAQLLACDIDPDAVRFCAEVLGATPIQGAYSPDRLELPDKVDLIWCGSLLTHVDSFRWKAFLSFFERSLADGGLLVFTTHGPTAVDQLRGVTIRDFSRPVENMLDDYETYGFAYSDYYDAPREYGISLSSPEWVRRELEQVPNLRLVGYTEAGWDDHQDVVACVLHLTARRPPARARRPRPAL